MNKKLFYYILDDTKPVALVKIRREEIQFADDCHFFQIMRFTTESKDLC